MNKGLLLLIGVAAYIFYLKKETTNADPKEQLVVDTSKMLLTSDLIDASPTNEPFSDHMDQITPADPDYDLYA